jgi:hypothetical protein
MRVFIESVDFVRVGSGRAGRGIRKLPVEQTAGGFRHFILIIFAPI